MSFIKRVTYYEENHNTYRVHPGMFWGDRTISRISGQDTNGWVHVYTDHKGTEKLLLRINEQYVVRIEYELDIH